MKEAQKFPADFDGIIAGAPANNQTHLQVWSIWVAQEMNKMPDSYLPPAKLAVLHKAVVAACDANDGVKDGVLNDPTKCHFDPKTIECKGADSATCLTLRASSGGAGDLCRPEESGRQRSFPDFEPGSEMGWSILARQASRLGGHRQLHLRCLQESRTGTGRP